MGGSVNLQKEEDIRGEEPRHVDLGNRGNPAQYRMLLWPSMAET